MAKVSHLPMRRYPTDHSSSSDSTASPSTGSPSLISSPATTSSPNLAASFNSSASNVDNFNFYPPANKRTPDKSSKRTWGQRLKLGKPPSNDNNQRSNSSSSSSSILSNGHGSASVISAITTTNTTTSSKTIEVLDYSGLQQVHQQQQQHQLHRYSANVPHQQLTNSLGAGSRDGHHPSTMKYADSGWVYGTMRGLPPPMHHPHAQHLHHHHPGPPPMAAMSMGGPMGFFPMAGPEVAVVICCCPEYLNGTKRDVKKASVCKKCKGSRLPLAPIGGTMRLTSGASFMVPPMRSAGGTVKLASTYGKKSRPSILSSGGDPYDFMRRSRLSQPVEQQPSKSVAESIKEKLRRRAKSTSPSKGRGRPEKRAPSPTGSKTSDNRSLSASRSSINNSKGFKDLWVEPEELPDDPEPTGRKSILRCDINPYDLISLSTGLNNEFSPSNEADDYDLSVHSQKYEKLLDSLYANRYNPAANIAAISGQRIKLFDGDAAAPSVYDDVDEYVYDPVEVQSDPSEDQPRVEVIPERPPRTKHKNDSPKEDDVKSLPNQISSSESVTHSAIKSILKRPGSVTSAPSGPPPVPKDKPGFDTIRLNQTLVQRLAKLTSDENIFSKNNSINLRSTKSFTGTAKDSQSKRNSGSQFYLPNPSINGSTLGLGSRKKVHFLVENEVIDDDKLFAQLLLSETGNQPANSKPPTITIVEVSPKTPEIQETAEKSLEDPPPLEEDANKENQKEQQTNKVKFDAVMESFKSEILQKKAGLVPNGKEKPKVPDKPKDVVGKKIESEANGNGAGETNQQNGNGDSSPWSVHRRSAPIRRSFSERVSPPRVTSFNGSSDLQQTSSAAVNRSPQFIDTMALRIKSPRADARRVFEEDSISSSSYSSSTGSSVGTMMSGSRMRPRVPPPPPPPPPPPLASSTNSSSPDQNPIDSENRANSDDANVYEDFCFDLTSGSERSSGRSSTASRTVVQVSTPVAPPPSTSSFSRDAVHRLEIKHEDEDSSYESMGQKKTSILITGDGDCYSTVNVDDDNETPLYQSSVVVNDVIVSSGISQTSSNTVTISVNSPTSTLQHPRSNRQSNLQQEENNHQNNSTSIIPIGNITSVTVTTNPSQDTEQKKAGKTFINLQDFKSAPERSVDDDEDDDCQNSSSYVDQSNAIVPNEAKSKESLEKLLRNPVEAVKRNLVPHFCGKHGETEAATSMETSAVVRRQKQPDSISSKAQRNSFIAKLLEDPMLGHLAEGLDYELVVKLIENSLLRLKESRTQLDMSGTKDEDDVSKMIEESLVKLQEERLKASLEGKKVEKDSKRSSISSGNSYGSATYELMEFDAAADLSDCYQSCSSDLTVDDDANSSRSKFYQMLVDATLSEIEITTTTDDDHHYESIRLNGDPIYEEISDIPPPLPLTAPPITEDHDREKRNGRSIFEGASKYDILSYLVDAKERGIALEESFNFQFGNASDIILEEEEDENITDLRHHQRQISDISSRLSHISNISDSSEDTSLLSSQRKASEIERNDSGVGSETSKTSRSKWQNSASNSLLNKISPIHLCEDCDGPVETQITESGVMYAPLVCRKCGKKRAERKEIITEIVETEEKYGRDLQIILEEFYQPMLVAGLLNQDQLSAIFLNVEELLENNQFLAERMRDALDIAMEQGDEDLLTVNAGKIFLEAAPMLHAFESYCVRQGAASLLLANLEKEKELLRIFLRVSQMENAVLRRMNLNSFLMVPVQRVTKYPLLLARLFKVTPTHLEGKELLKQAQEKIELHLNHMNREARDVPTKLWRRIASSTPTGRRLSCELDMINIKLRKMAIDVLEWNTEEVRFAIEGRLLFTQPNDGNWKKSRTIKLTSINALLVTNGKPSPSYKPDRATTELLNFPRHTGIREASLLLVREKNGRYTLLREPLYLDRCVVCTENDWEDYFEVQEILSKDSFIFKAEDGAKTKQWYSQLQYHSQGMGTWRKRRNALANIMINGMMTRT
ncbi:uncharacterized protein LOC129751195 [Uranotaenia lowii]|uniref:uncharacterized protein LOC129751195 n=1 Tax=Uranotaenia lowii TaxID=190385 RepID=UPI002479F8B7|nr:uncharacterized protein LOC129751195 [Uranotaenia lowii]XP_055602537.1 uncharacterized protein LOC129751195 [Uranotaenia lowii]